MSNKWMVNWLCLTSGWLIGYVQQVIETRFDVIGSSRSREGEDLFGFVVGSAL